MNFNEAFPSESKYLTSADLGKNMVTVTIERYAHEDVGKGEEVKRKVVLYFAGKKKGLACNVTNGLEIKEAYGEDLDLWIGCRIALYVTKVPFGGKMVDGIRVRIPPSQVVQGNGAAVAQAKVVKPAPVAMAAAIGSPADMDDEIPF